jgi:hypothetical protein
MNNSEEDGYWDIAARINADPGQSRLNIFNSEGGDILTLRGNNRVGINDANPGYPLEVNGNGQRRAINVFNTLPDEGTSATYNYGIIVNLSQANTSGSSRLYNVYGYSTDADAYLSYGVYGRADNASNFNYGLFGIAPASNGYAVYSSGNMFSTGSYLPSDEKLKNGLRSYDSGLAVVMQLRPKSYRYDLRRFDFMNLPEGEQYGFVAQDIERILPHLTRTAYQERTDPESATREPQGTEFKVVNYVGLIPILTSAIQEQQQLIKDQNQKIRALEQRLAALEAKLAE